MEQGEGEGGVWGGAAGGGGVGRERVFPPRRAPHLPPCVCARARVRESVCARARVSELVCARASWRSPPQVVLRFLTRGTWPGRDQPRWGRAEATRIRIQAAGARRNVTSDVTWGRVAGTRLRDVIRVFRGLCWAGAGT